MTLQEYVSERTAVLIASVSDECRRAKGEQTAESIHHLRVAIRRLSENLRTFADVFPRGAAKAVRKELKVAMTLAGEVRNCDIATDLLRKSKLNGESSFSEARERAAIELSAVLSKWNRKQKPDAWRDRLFE